MQVAMALSQDELTARELQQLLPDVPQASLYRAIKQLFTGGAIEVVKEERKGGAVERTYSAVPEETLMTPEEFTSSDGAEFMAAVQTFADWIPATVARSIAHDGPQWREDRYSLRHESVWLTAAEREELSSDLKAVYAKYSALPERDDARRHALMVVAVPETGVIEPSDVADVPVDDDRVDEEPNN